MKLTNTQRGLMTIFGGFTVHLVIGAVFMWGTLNVYITSYFRQLNDHNLPLSVGGAIFPVMMLSVATGMPLGIKAIQIFGSARWFVMGASIVSCFLVLISSYCTMFWQYVLVYGIAFGLVSGSIYFVPIYMGYLYFPKKKGFVSGAVLAGYGLCSLVMGMTFFSYVNPDNLSQQKDSDGYSYFQGPSVSVAQRVPESIRKMCIIYFILSVFGSCFIMYHPDQVGEEERRLKRQLQAKKEQEENLKTQLERFSQENIYTFENKDEQKEFKEKELIEKKKLMMIHNIEVIEKQEKVIQKQLELQQEEDQRQAYLPSIQDMTFKQSTANDTLTKTNYTDDAYAGKTNKRITLNPNIIVGGTYSDNIADDIDCENKPKHTNDIVEQLEVDIKELEVAIKNQEKDLNKRSKIVEERQQKIQEYNKLGAPNALVVFKQPQYYMSLLLGFLAIGFPILINGNYKTVAKEYGFLNDSYQTLVGALVSAANGLSRPCYSSLLDKFTFKQILTCLLCIQIFLSLTTQLTDVSEAFFAIWMFLINTTFGGVLAMWPVFSAQLNGVKIGSKVYGTYWWAFGFSNFLQFIFVYFLNPRIGFNNIFYIYTGIAFCALLLLRLYNFKIDWSKYYIKEEEKNQQLKGLEGFEVLPIKTMS